MIAPASLSALFVCCFSFATAGPTRHNDNSDGSQGNGNVQYIGQSTSSANGITVQMSQRVDNGVCVSRVNIFGNGINKTADLPCDQTSLEIINTNDFLWVANQYFSDEPKTLVHVTNKQCDKEYFEEKDAKILPSKTEILGADECGKVRAQIADLQNNQQQWNNDWFTFTDQRESIDHLFENLFD